MSSSPTSSLSSRSSSSIYNNNYGSGGFDTALFVDQPVDPNLICTICHNVLQKPTSVCSNGHVSCLDCIAMWKAQQQQQSRARNNNGNTNTNNSNSVKCPDCRLPLLSQQCLVRPLQSIILSMQVKCPNRAPPESEASASTAAVINDNNQDDDDDIDKIGAPQKKKLRSSSRQQQRKKKAPRSNQQQSEPDQPPQCCQWQGTLSEYLDRHCRKDCLFLQATCSLCDTTLPATQLDHHVQHKCPRRLVPCSLCGEALEAAEHVSHKDNVCPERTIPCRYCHKRLRRKHVGYQWLDRDMNVPRRMYSGHLKECPKIMVPCPQFCHHGCNTMVRREDIATHNRDCLEEHAQLVATALTQVVDEKTWKEKTLVWVIPRVKLQRIRLNGLESQRVKVGDFMAFLVLTVAPNQNSNGDSDSDSDVDDGDGTDGHVRVKICVEEPLYTPFIRRVTFRTEQNQIAAVNAAAASQSNNNNNHDNGDSTPFLQCVMPQQSKEMVQDHSFIKDTCAIKVDLMHHRGANIRRAKISDLQDAAAASSQNNITFRATFSLKCPDVISVACAN